MMILMIPIFPTQLSVTKNLCVLSWLQKYPELRMVGVGMMMGNMFNMMNATPSFETIGAAPQPAQPEPAQLVVEDWRRCRWGIPSGGIMAMASWQPELPRLNWIPSGYLT